MDCSPQFTHSINSAKERDSLEAEHQFSRLKRSLLQSGECSLFAPHEEAVSRIRIFVFPSLASFRGDAQSELKHTKSPSPSQSFQDGVIFLSGVCLVRFVYIRHSCHHPVGFRGSDFGTFRTSFPITGLEKASRLWWLQIRIPSSSLIRIFCFFHHNDLRGSERLPHHATMNKVFF